MVEGLESRIQQVVEDVAETPLVSAIIEAWNDRVNMPKHKEQGQQQETPEVGTAKHENPRPDSSLPNLELVLQRIPEGKAPAAEAEDKNGEGSYGDMGNPLQIDTIPAIVDFKEMSPT